MLALRATRLQPHSLSLLGRPTHARRLPAQRRFFIQNLCDGFLDLALALPIPPSLPTYSTTIIVVTVVTRFALLPVAIWGKNRSRKIEELVLPEIERSKPIVAKQVFEGMKKARIRGDKEYLKEVHMKKTLEVLTAQRKALFKKYKCSPLPSIILPPLSQLPIFVTMSICLGRMSLPPTPFDSESFLTLTTLAHPDPTMTLPIVLGLLTMANVESSNWVMNAAERERARNIEELNAKKLAEGGQPAIRPKNLIKTGMRILSVGRIIIAAITPGSIALYWVTSAAFGLIQTWIMDWMDIRRRRRLALSKPPPPLPPASNRPPVRLSPSSQTSRSRS